MICLLWIASARFETMPARNNCLINEPGSIPEGSQVLTSDIKVGLTINHDGGESISLEL